MLKNVLSMTAICPLFIGDYKKGSRKPWLWFQCVRRAAGKGCLREYDPAWWPSWPSRVETFWPHSSGTVCLYKKERGGKKKFHMLENAFVFLGFLQQVGWEHWDVSFTLTSCVVRYTLIIQSCTPLCNFSLPVMPPKPSIVTMSASRPSKNKPKICK